MKVCIRCGHRLTTHLVSPGYKYYCPNCDEDMYEIEAIDKEGYSNDTME